MRMSNKKGKKIISLILITVMVMGLLPQMAMPVYATALITSESILNTAINNAENGDTIKLAGDIPLTSTLLIANKKLTLDLNGKNLTSNTTTIKLEGTTILSIVDFSPDAKGVVSSTGSYAIINDATLNINAGTIQSTGECSSISNRSTLSISGGMILAGGNGYASTYEGDNDTIIANGGITGKVSSKSVTISGNPSITVTLSSLTSNRVLIYWELTGDAGSIVLDGTGLLSIANGTIVGQTRMEDDYVDVSKFTLINVPGKTLEKSGTKLVLGDIISKSISISTPAPKKGVSINSSVTPITGTTAAVTWSSDNGNTWAVASGIYAPATVYKTKYVYTANSGYVFDNTMATGDVVVANSQGKVYSATVSTFKNPNDTLTALVTWPATGTEINATFKPGTSTGKIKATITGSPSDHFAIRLYPKDCTDGIGNTVPSDAQIYNPEEEVDAISSSASCVPGAITPWLSVYDVDANGKIVGLYEKELDTAEINLTPVFSKGDGTEENPYQVETVDQLKYMGLFSYNSMENKPNHFILNNDIDLGIAPYNTGKGWPSIGFAGNFDGNGKTIKNLMVNVPIELDDMVMGGKGLFGIATGGTVKSLAIINANVNGSSNVGILAGLAFGEHIEKVYVSGAVTGRYNVGGLVGLETMADKTILNCYSSASVSGSGVVGGLVGKAEASTIKTSYATGKVSIVNPTDEEEEDTNVLYRNLHGGLIGFALESTRIKNIFENNYYDQETTSQVDLTGSLPKGTTEMKDKTTYVGFDFNTVWGIDPSINSGYPYLQGLAPNKEQTVPVGISVTAPTSPTSSDGKITGTVAGMEYRLSTASTWTAITDTSVTGLAAGSYQIRYAEKTGYNAGAVVTVTIPDYTAPTATPTPSPTPKPTTGGGSSGGGSSENKTPPSSSTTPTSSTPSGGASSIKNVGEIVKDQQTDSSAPSTSLNTSTAEFKSNVFTAEELAKIETGENAKVILKVTDIASTVSEADKKLIAQDLKKDATVMYVDLSLYKKIGNGPETKITETKNKINISIEVPVELRSSDVTVSRTYQIVRVHEGVVTVIDGTYDPSTHLFTFETDRFSTYALTFEEANVNGDNLSVVNSFNPLRLTAKASETSEKLSYTKVSGADGYLIYGAPCGIKNKLEKLADVSGTVTSYNHKGLKKGTYYKYLVQAYKIVDGKHVVLATSKVIHSITESKSYGNPAKVTTKTSAVVLKGSTSKNITSKVLLPKGKKSRNHTDILQYETTNEKVAIVTSKGTIKAIGKGTCYVYVYAQNGAYTRIKVTVK